MCNGYDGLLELICEVRTVDTMVVMVLLELTSEGRAVDVMVVIVCWS
jgi:hypothetical protein